MNTIDTNSLNPNSRQAIDGKQEQTSTQVDKRHHPDRDHVNVDKLFLNNMRPQQATDFLAQHINRRLGERFSVAPANTGSYLDNFNGAIAAANRILQTASQAFNKLSETAGIPHAANQVREEIDRGYSEALGAFNAFGRIAPETSDSLNQVRELLDRSYQHAPLNGDIGQTQQLYGQSDEYRLESSTSLSLETAEGDIVTIEISRDYSQINNSFNTRNGERDYKLSQRERNESIDIRVNVKGELSDEERESINHLVQQLNQVTQQHDEGHDVAMQQKLENLSYDQRIISQFTFNHQIEETYASAEFHHEGEAIPTNTGSNTVNPDVDIEKLEGAYQHLPLKDLHQAVLQIMEKLREFQQLLSGTASQPEQQRFTAEA